MKKCGIWGLFPHFPDVVMGTHYAMGQLIYFSDLTDLGASLLAFICAVQDMRLFSLCCRNYRGLVQNEFENVLCYCVRKYLATLFQKKKNLACFLFASMTHFAMRRSLNLTCIFVFYLFLYSKLVPCAAVSNLLILAFLVPIFVYAAEKSFKNAPK